MKMLLIAAALAVAAVAPASADNFVNPYAASQDGGR